MTAPPPTTSHPLPRIRPWMVALALCLIYLGLIFHASGANPMAFLYMPEPPSPEHPEGTEGYDGQFVYYIAVNPIASPEHLDIPAYRLQRILLPVLAHALAFGQTPLIPWMLLIINLAAFTGGMLLLEQLLDAEGVSPWYAIAYGLSAGIFMSVRLSLTEPLAYGLVILALWLDRRDRPWWSAITFALAGLAKEPALVFVLGYMAWMAFERRWLDALRLGVLGWTPYIAWQIAMLVWLGQVGLGPGGGYRTPFELVPYMGFVRILLDTGNLAAFLAFAALVVPVVIAPSLWGLISTIRDLIRHTWHPYVFLLLANAAVLTIIPYSTYREPLGILRFLPGLTVAVLIYGAHFRKFRLLRYCSLLWLSTMAFAVISG